MSNNIHQTPIFSNPVKEPLPELIAESIRQATLSGRLKTGEQLPSEPDFAAQLGVSRMTLREAIRILVGQGILERRRGVGTFVIYNPLISIDEGLETLFSTSELIHKKGYEPGTSGSQIETIPALPHLADILDLAPDSLLIHFSRTRTANGIPVIHCEEYLPETVLSPDVQIDTLGDWSLYELLESVDLGVVSAICRLTPVQADQKLANRLKVAEGYPLLLLRQTHFAKDHRPILYCENYHNSAITEFHLIRKR